MSASSLKSKQEGMTLIEIMIALVLGIFLIAGVIQIFLGTKQSYRILDNLSRMQENGRFAMEFISRDIREAGLNEQCYTQAVPTAIAGTNNDGHNSSDSITIQESDAACPISPAVLATKSITYTVASGTSSSSALFKREIEDIDGDGDTLDAGENVNRELIEGIENIQISYGEDTNDDFTPDYYVSANNVVDMEKVVGIRINLVVVSLDNNLSTVPVDYQFNGSTHTPSTGDHRLRREFSSTIAVRNRLP